MTLGDYDCLIFIRSFCIDTPDDLLACSVKKFTVEMRFYTNCIFLSVVRFQYLNVTRFL